MSKSAHFQRQEAVELENLKCQCLMDINYEMIHFPAFYDLWTSLKSFLKVIVIFLHAYFDPSGHETETG